MSTHTPLRGRGTPDLIIIWLAAIVGFVVILGTLGAIVWKILDNDADISGVVRRLGDLVNTLVGAVVGYLAGRGVIPAAGDNPGPED